MIEPVFALGLAMLLGLIVGSFLNVCIYRWPRDLSVVRPHRSFCPACEKTIAWYDNIPIASYFILRARCRNCSEPIPLSYPLVELSTGLLFLYFAWADATQPWVVLKLCIFAAMQVALIFTDLETRILPDEFTLGGTVIGILLAIVVPLQDDFTQALMFFSHLELQGRLAWVFNAAFGAGFPALLLWGGGWIYYKIRGREGLGLGDVKLVAMVGSFLGLQDALLTMIVGSLAGSIIGFVYIKATRQDPNTYELPFGSFLGAAALAMAMLGKQLANWYGF